MVTSRTRPLATMLAALACLAVAGCTSASPRATGATASRPATAQPTGQPPDPAATTPGPPQSAAPAGIRNLLVTPAVRSQLLTPYLTMMDFKAADIAGTVPDSIYYAYDPATRTYWALAIYKASRNAPMNVLVNLQDGGNAGMYTKTAAGPWHVTRGGVPWECVEGQYFPEAVLAVWGLTITAPCPSLSPSASPSQTA
jgi:hypothetical protein